MVEADQISPPPPTMIRAVSDPPLANVSDTQARVIMTSNTRTADAVYHQVAVTPRDSWRAPGVGSAEMLWSGLFTTTTIRA